MAFTAMELVALAKKTIQEINLENTEAVLTEQLIIDVREPAEFIAGHLPNAINIPRGVLEFRIGQHPSFQNPQTKIIVYCQSGGRSALAAESLHKMGFVNTVSMAGGFSAWQASGRSVIA
jgi:rhodanese-related sulfurtransferase